MLSMHERTVMKISSRLTVAWVENSYKSVWYKRAEGGLPRTNVAQRNAGQTHGIPASLIP